MPYKNTNLNMNDACPVILVYSELLYGYVQVFIYLVVHLLFMKVYLYYSRWLHKLLFNKTQKCLAAAPGIYYNLCIDPCLIKLSNISC